MFKKCQFNILKSVSSYCLQKHKFNTYKSMEGVIA